MKFEKERRAAAVKAASVAAFPVIRRLSSQVVSKTAQRALAAAHYFNHGRGDWICVICGSANFSDRGACMLCQSKRPAPGTAPPLGGGNGGSTRKSAGRGKKGGKVPANRTAGGRQLRTPHWHADAIFLHWWKSRVVNFIGKDIMRLQHQHALQHNFATANSNPLPSESSRAPASSPSDSKGNATPSDQAVAATSGAPTSVATTKGKDAQALRTQLETSARFSSGTDFYWRLENFLQQRFGIQRRELILGGRPLDLVALYRLVLERGGYKQMEAESKKNKGIWDSVFELLPNYNKEEPSASFRLRKLYEKYLLDFERSEQGIPLPRRIPQGGAEGRRKRKRDSSGEAAQAQKRASNAAPPAPRLPSKGQSDKSDSKAVGPDASAAAHASGITSKPADESSK